MSPYMPNTHGEPLQKNHPLEMERHQSDGGGVVGWPIWELCSLLFCMVGVLLQTKARGNDRIW